MEPTGDVTVSAQTLAGLGASKGGKARAMSLSPEERQAISRKAASARWGTNIAQVSHAGVLQIGDRKMMCAVLDDGRRVLNQTTMLSALERAGKSRRGPGDERRAPFLSAANLQPFISDELRQLVDPIEYRDENGRRAFGYEAKALPLICDVYLEAREQHALAPKQRPVARAAEVLTRALARVGIIALIDEATGYQEVRAQRELEQILNAYIAVELRPWTRTFPPEFFEQIYRLQGWEYKPDTAKRTPYVGHLVNKYIYDELPPGVLEELREKNPKTKNGYRAHKHHQFLTANTGVPHLDRQLSTVTTLMRISLSKAEFEELFERAFPPAQQRLPLVIEVN